MRNVWTIAWKELKSYFGSPMAYIIGAVFLALTGYFFVQSISGSFAEASIRGWLLPSTFVFVLWSPVITMRLFAEEQKLGTLELLLTAPLRDWEVVLGKFLASLGMLIGTLSLTVFYVMLLFWFGQPDGGPLLTGYLGLLLYGAATLAVGLLASSLTGNQIVASVVSFGALLLLTLTDQAAQATTGLSAQVLQELSLTSHFTDFARGILDTNNLMYYVTFTAFILFLTVRTLESRRWR
ncbi:MAG: ABC transporter permease subunit [Chloroflexi bacterium]|nr:ABC transporter permease subunit [Chloroflexota bacterium]